MKKFLSLLLSIPLSFYIMSGCSGVNDEYSDSTNSEASVDATITQLQDEDESLELRTQKVEDSFFYGTWKAESDRASYMYGNVTIIINKDGTWDGNITEEELHGEWKHKGNGIRLTSDVIPFNMVYSDNNNVILQETDDSVRVVLTKQ